MSQYSVQDRKITVGIMNAQLLFQKYSILDLRIKLIFENLSDKIYRLLFIKVF